MATFHQLGKVYHAKMLTPATTKALLRPYITELGYLAAAWNQLQHNLSSLFTLLVAGGKDPIGQAVWHAAESDFVQRKMLRAFVEVDQSLLFTQRALLAQQAKEILWILDQIDGNLRHKRNNAIHAPLMTITGVWDGAVRHRVEAHFNPHNPRAKPLRGKNLRDEFKDYAAHANMLSAYAVRIWQALHDPEHAPWPNRPSVPQAHKKKRTLHQGKRRRPPSPPEASQA